PDQPDGDRRQSRVRYRRATQRSSRRISVPLQSLAEFGRQDLLAGVGEVADVDEEGLLVVPGGEPVVGVVERDARRRGAACQLVAYPRVYLRAREPAHHGAQGCQVLREALPFRT